MCYSLGTPYKSEGQEDRWQTIKRAKIRLVAVHHNRMESIAALRVKARATRSNLIAIVAMISVAATSNRGYPRSDTDQGTGLRAWAQFLRLHA